mgnify:CR=1 FL=1
MDTNNIITLKEVAQDLQDGKDFYDQNQNGVGDYFWDSLVGDIESLTIYAGIHPKRFDLFQMFAKRFPYAIYYDIIDSTMYVVGVLPMRRNPEWIKSQLEAREH